MNDSLLKQLLTWIIGSGGAGILAYWIMARVPWLIALKPEPKRYVVYVLCAALGILAWLVSVLMRYVPQPTTDRAWIEAIVAVAGAAITVSQVVHARVWLSKK